MAKKSSTGSLSKEAHLKQNQRYAKGDQYDYVIVGTGSAALTVGALLAHAGYTICMLEAHDIPGGYAQTFKMGDYEFCAQVHYIWGCGPGGKIYEFLKHIGLEKDITFELYNIDGYDLMVMPDGTKVSIPCGYEKLAANIDAAYPGQKANVEKFTNILSTLRDKMGQFPQRKIKLLEYVTKSHKFFNLLKYKNKTVQDVFDECNLSKEAQSVLIANAGDMMAPPEELSIFSYAGLFGGYNTGAYYPTKHFKYYVNRLAEFITQHDGCHIYYETPVTKFNLEGDEIKSVETKDRKSFTAKKGFIVNMDPQTAAGMIGWEHFPKKFKKPLKYTYSQSGMVIYLGLEGIDLRDFGFGKHNTWHLEQWDMNQMWKEQLDNNFDNPWIFMSTPSLHTDDPGTTPEGGQILEIATLTDYKSFKEAQELSYRDYAQKKSALANRILDLVEEKYIPNLREHIKVKVVGTTRTNEDFVLAPQGNAYGSHMNPEQMTLGRLKAFTPFKNLWWCNASSGYGGVYGTVSTGVQLYMDLTDDRFFDSTTAPSDQTMIDAIRERWAKEQKRVISNE